MAIQHQALNATFDKPHSTSKVDQDKCPQLLAPKTQLTETAMKPPQTEHDSRLSEFLTAEEIAQIRKMQNSPPLEMHLPQDCCQCAKRGSHAKSSLQAQDPARQSQLEKSFEQLTCELPTRTSSTSGGLGK